MIRGSLVFGLVLVVACGSDPNVDAGPTADAAIDAGADAGVIALSCGAATCNGTVEFCLQVPTGPCQSRDGGTCGLGEESCQVTGVPGCTPPQTRDCTPIPASCTSCPCIILQPICTGSTQANCSGLPRTGFSAQCPFP